MNSSSTNKKDKEIKELKRKLNNVNTQKNFYKKKYNEMKEDLEDVIEKEVAKRERLQIVNVVPQPKAGGSFATIAYKNFKSPVAVEHIKAQAGMDIGDTLIGMHLEDVAVPLRLDKKQIGEAHLVCARTRAKFIGGERAVYDENLL